MIADVDRYWSLTPMDDDAYHTTVRHFNGHPVGEAWRPIGVQFEKTGDRGDLFGFAPNVPVFSERAYNELYDLVRNQADFYELSCEGDRLHVLNVFRRDILDEDKSEMVRFKSSERVMSVSKYRFREDDVEEYPVFRLTQLANSRVFVSDIFVKRVEAAGLAGFHFSQVWPSDSLTENVQPPLPSASSARKVLKPSERRLTEAEQRKISRLAAEGLRDLDPPAEEPRRVIRALDDSLIEMKGRAGVLRESSHEYVEEVGFLWGECVCSALEWEWTVLNYTGTEQIAVVSPDRRFVLFPVQHIDDIIHDRQEVNLVLFVNMIAQDQVPGASPADYFVLS